MAPKDEFVKALLQEHESLIAKTQTLIDAMDLPEGCFTFNDGDTWWQTGKEIVPDPNIL